MLSLTATCHPGDLLGSLGKLDSEHISQGSTAPALSSSELTEFSIHPQVVSLTQLSLAVALSLSIQ